MTAPFSWGEILRKLAAFAFSFSAAIFLARYALPFAWLYYFAAFFAAMGLISLLFKDERRLLVLLTALGFATGFAWNAFYINTFIKPLDIYDGKTETITAEVLSYPQKTTYGSSLYIKIKTEKFYLNANTLLYADDEQIVLSPGDKITLKARLSLSSFSYGQVTDYYTSQGVYLIAYKKGDVHVEKAAVLPLKYYPQFFSKNIKEKIAEIYEKDTYAFMTALIIGDRTQLNRDTSLTTAMSTTGVTHVVAVSGMHISFLVGLIMLFMRKKRFAALICAPLILIFMAMVGFTASVVRAGIMQLFMLTAPLFNRENDPLTSFSAALLLLLFINPYSASNAALQLSFASIGGMMLVSSRINDYLLNDFFGALPLKNKVSDYIFRFISASFSSSIGALLFTAPIIALYFNNVSLVAPIANLLILWAISFAFCGGLISIILGLIFVPLGSAAAIIISWLVRYIVFIVKGLSALRFASVSMLSIFTRAWLILVYGMIGGLFIMRKRKPRLIIPSCILVIALCISIILSGYKADAAKMSVTAIDVGQGQSIVITAKQRTFVVDCGGDRASTTGNSTADYLKSINRPDIDLLMLTHFDTDHINGVTQLLQRESVRLIAMPNNQFGNEDREDNRGKISALAKEKGIEVLYITDVTHLYSEGISLYLFPGKGATGNNDNGIIILCSAGDYDTLITGDADSALERRFIRSAELPDIELLVVGHHGSKSSTSDELLNALKPETAIISVGYNSYGHPSREVLERLGSRKIEVLRTDISGNVTVRAS